MAINLEELGLTNDDLIERVVDRLVDEFHDGGSVRDYVDSALAKEVNKRVGLMIDNKLEVVMRSLLDEKFTPVDHWGEVTGDEQTLRDHIKTKADQFWTQHVGKDGTPCSRYKGQPRYKAVLENIATKAFRDAIVGAFHPGKFRELAAKVGRAQQDKIAAPTDATQAIVAEFGITEGQRESLLEHFLGDYDRTRYGLASALGRVAQDEQDADKADALEEAAGRLMTDRKAVPVACYA